MSRLCVGDKCLILPGYCYGLTPEEWKGNVCILLRPFRGKLILTDTQCKHNAIGWIIDIPDCKQLKGQPFGIEEKFLIKLPDANDKELFRKEEELLKKLDELEKKVKPNVKQQVKPKSKKS